MKLLFKPEVSLRERWKALQSQEYKLGRKLRKNKLSYIEIIKELMRLEKLIEKEEGKKNYVNK